MPLPHEPDPPINPGPPEADQVHQGPAWTRVTAKAHRTQHSPKWPPQLRRSPASDPAMSPGSAAAASQGPCNGPSMSSLVTPANLRPYGANPSAATSTASLPPAPVERDAPYLTHVARHHGHLTLVAPDNLGARRQPGYKDPPDSTFDARGSWGLPSFHASTTTDDLDNPPPPPPSQHKIKKRSEKTRRKEREERQRRERAVASAVANAGRTPSPLPRAQSQAQTPAGQSGGTAATSMSRGESNSSLGVPGQAELQHSRRQRSRERPAPALGISSGSHLPKAATQISSQIPPSQRPHPQGPRPPRQDHATAASPSRLAQGSSAIAPSRPRAQRSSSNRGPSGVTTQTQPRGSATARTEQSPRTATSSFGAAPPRPAVIPATSVPASRFSPMTAPSEVDVAPSPMTTSARTSSGSHHITSIETASSQAAASPSSSRHDTRASTQPSVQVQSDQHLQPHVIHPLPQLNLSSDPSLLDDHLSLGLLDPCHLLLSPPPAYSGRMPLAPVTVRTEGAVGGEDAADPGQSGPGGSASSSQAPEAEHGARGSSGAQGRARGERYSMAPPSPPCSTRDPAFVATGASQLSSSPSSPAALGPPQVTGLTDASAPARWSSSPQYPSSDASDTTDTSDSDSDGVAASDPLVLAWEADRSAGRYSLEERIARDLERRRRAEELQANGTTEAAAQRESTRPIGEDGARRPEAVQRVSGQQDEANAGGGDGLNGEARPISDNADDQEQEDQEDLALLRRRIALAERENNSRGVVRALSVHATRSSLRRAGRAARERRGRATGGIGAGVDPPVLEEPEQGRGGESTAGQEDDGDNAPSTPPVQNRTSLAALATGTDSATNSRHLPVRPASASTLPPLPMSSLVETDVDVFSTTDDRDDDTALARPARRISLHGHRMLAEAAERRLAAEKAAKTRASAAATQPGVQSVQEEDEEETEAPAAPARLDGSHSAVSSTDGVPTRSAVYERLFPTSSGLGTGFLGTKPASDPAPPSAPTPHSGPAPPELPSKQEDSNLPLAPSSGATPPSAPASPKPRPPPPPPSRHRISASLPTLPSPVTAGNIDRAPRDPSPLLARTPSLRRAAPPPPPNAAAILAARRASLPRTSLPPSASSSASSAPGETLRPALPDPTPRSQVPAPRGRRPLPTPPTPLADDRIDAYTALGRARANAAGSSGPAATSEHQSRTFAAGPDGEPVRGGGDETCATQADAFPSRQEAPGPPLPRRPPRSVVEAALARRSDRAVSASAVETTSGASQVPELSMYTDLDLLLARLEGQDERRTEQGIRDGGEGYDDFLLLSDVLGQAVPAGASASELAETLTVARVECERRRVTKSGKVKSKLSVVGVRCVDCAICLARFKVDQFAVVLPECLHIFHEHCIRSWFRLSRVCPVCRAPTFPDLQPPQGDLLQ